MALARVALAGSLSSANSLRPRLRQSLPRLRQSLSTTTTAAATPPPQPPQAGKLPPLRHRIFDWFKDDLVPRWRKRAMYYTGGLALLGAGAAYYIWHNLSGPGIDDNMLTVFRDGGRAGWDTAYAVVDAKAKVSRENLQQRLTSLLQPTESNQYVAVVGENGTGKSTAIRKAIRALPYPKGAVYFLSPSTPSSFATQLATAVGFNADALDVEGGVRRRVSQTTKEERQPSAKEEPDATWTKLQPHLSKVATEFFRQHGRPAVLVIDAADLIAKKHPTFFRDLQDFAKAGADEGSLRVIFVASDGNALPLLQQNSSWSRGMEFEVGDITDDEAIKYLVGRDVPMDRAKDAVTTITGGRFALLNKYISSIGSGKSNDQIRDVYYKTTEKTLDGLGVDPTNELFRTLVRDTTVDTNKAPKMQGMTKGKLDALVKANIIAVHPDETYTFHSRHVESFIAGKIASSTVSTPATEQIASSPVAEK